MKIKQLETTDVEYSYTEYDRCQVPTEIVKEGEDEILEWIRENVDAEAQSVENY